MFFNKIRLYFTYRKFIERWEDVDNPYQKEKYFLNIMSINKLLFKIVDEESVYNQYINIPLSHTTLYKWFDEMEKFKYKLKRNKLVQQPILNISPIYLGDYLITEDGHRISYFSALKAVGEVLSETYALLNAQEEIIKDYAFKQYRELFNDGLSFLLTLPKLYNE